MKLISKETKTVKSAFSDEFENYLKNNRLKRLSMVMKFNHSHGIERLWD